MIKMFDMVDIFRTLPVFITAACLLKCGCKGTCFFPKSKRKSGKKSAMG